MEPLLFTARSFPLGQSTRERSLAVVALVQRSGWQDAIVSQRRRVAWVGLRGNHRLAIARRGLSDESDIVLVGAQRLGEKAEELGLQRLVGNHGRFITNAAASTVELPNLRPNRPVGRTVPD